MEPSSAGAVVLVQFPFSDLSRSKLRPAVVLAAVGRGEYILCQLTSNPYSDRAALELADAAFDSGSLRRVSYARPGKLFTAYETLFEGQVGTLRSEVLDELLNLVIEILRPQVITDR